MNLIRLGILLAAITLLPACTTVKGWFAGEPKAGEPAELVEFQETVETDKVWTYDAGDGTKKGAQQLQPAFRNGRVFVADYKGVLSGVDASTGDELWKIKTKLPFSGGPGTTDTMVMVGTEDGEVHAFLADTGTPVWIARVSSEVLAEPVEGDGIVVTRAIDGRVFGLDARNGRRLWV